MTSPHPSPSPSPTPQLPSTSASPSSSPPHATSTSTALPPSSSTSSPSSSSPPSSSSTATRKKVMSFFNSITSELQQTAIFTKHPTPSHSPQPSVSTPPINPIPSLTSPPLVNLTSTDTPSLTLTHSTPSPSPLFYLHQSVTAQLVPVPASPPTFTFHRLSSSSSPLLLQSSTSSSYSLTLSDLDTSIQCTSSTFPTSPPLTSPPIGPILLPPSFLSTLLTSFLTTSSLTFPFLDPQTTEELLLIIRRTSLRITTTSSTMRHTFRLSSSGGVTVDAVGRKGMRVRDGVTDRVWEGEGKSEEDRDKVVVLVRLLIEKPDFEEGEEVKRWEEKEKQAMSEAMEKRREEERKREEREREEREKEAQKQQAASTHAVAKEQPLPATQSPSPSSSPSSSSTPAVSTSPPLPSTPAPLIPASLAQHVPFTSSSSSIEVHLLPPGLYSVLTRSHSTLPSLTSTVTQLQAERDRLLAQLQSSAAQYSEDQRSFGRQLELLMGEKSEMMLTRDRERREWKEVEERMEEEVKEVKESVDGMKRQISQLNEELVKTKEEIKAYKTKEVDWQKERDTITHRHKAALDEVSKGNERVVEQVKEEMKKKEEKAQAKFVTMETGLKKELDLYRKELSKLKEKEHRVDVLEMENHKLMRELEGWKEKEREGEGKREEVNDERGLREREELSAAVNEKEDRIRQLELLVDNKQRELEELQEIGIDFADKEMSMESEVKRLEEEVSGLTSQLSTLQVQREEHRQSMDEKDEELKKLRDKADELESSNNYHKKKIVTLTQQIERSIKEKAQIKAQHTEELANAREEREEGKELKRENAELRKEVERLKGMYNEVIVGGGVGEEGVGVGVGLERKMEGMKELINSLTEQLTDKDEAFKHLRKTNQILGLRVKELEERFKEELKTGAGLGGGGGKVGMNGAGVKR